ncbi:hypothetical protein CTAYLR_001153 [Chrysophaeum taylorii]|uniref:RING-type domain-containing protein n=1 Tax=Chrysophaeum taylorii TaxID=2483200 RepID=A0AAD7UPY9_9STRA|nr:hypothetical protein CTAYLR_001153 [Chrysophaeum taylorii]
MAVKSPALLAAQLQRRLVLRSERKKKAQDSREWAIVEASFSKRSEFRCPICLEKFGGGSAVLLSCSHCFHAECLAAAERCLGKSCPICRKTKFQSRSAEAAVRSAAASIIEAAWRSKVARSERAKRRRELYAKGRGDPARRRDYLASAVVEYAERIERRVEERAVGLEALFAESDAALLESSALFGPTEAEWKAAEARARRRAEPNCAICVGPLVGDGRPLVLLSCSHEYHRQCLTALEAFNVGSTRPTCPYCRAPYHARPPL